MEILPNEMGLIREPKNLDFTFLDKPWTEEEKKEFSTFIKQRMMKRNKATIKPKKVVS